ncbi:MAG: cation:proton antiporter [Chlamydiota bacterium]
MESVTPVIQIFSILLGFLLLAAITQSACKIIKVPYAVALVLLGIIITNTSIWFFPGQEYPFPGKIADNLKSDFIIYICLPTLIYASAFSLDTRLLMKIILPVHVLAIPGLLLSTAVIGLIVSSFTSIPLVPALLLGVILSATDPVAVVSLFHQIGAPKKLTTLVEGESLFNDATTLVTAKILFGFVVAGVFTSQEIFHGVNAFFVEFFGGILVGAIVALLFGYILGKVEGNPDIELTLTTIIAYASFMIAQVGLHCSGVMATATAGLVMSGWGRTKISPSVSEYLNAIWKFLAHIANTYVFLFVGLSIYLGPIRDAIIPLIVVIIAMLFSRFLAIFGLIPLINILPGIKPIDIKSRMIIYWGGLRGAIALAIVLSLGPFPQKELFITLVTGAVLFTLVVKGLTIKQLMHLLRLDVPPLQDKLAMAQAKLSAKKHVVNSIPQLMKGGLFSGSVVADLKDNCQAGVSEARAQIVSIEQELTEQDEKSFFFLECIGIEKKVYTNLFTKNLISENCYRYLSYLLTLDSDAIRYDGEFDFNIDGRQRKSLIHKLSNTKIRNIFPFNLFVNHIQNQIIPKSFEKNWAQHQAALMVLKHIENFANQNPEKVVVFYKAYSFYNSLKSETQSTIDNIAQDFPVLTTEMQKLLARKLEIHSELEELNVQSESGSIPGEVVKHLKKSLELEIIQLGKQRIKKISLSRKELLSKVPFFKDIPEKELGSFLNILKSRVYDQGDAVIHQGDTGDSLFMIMSGVVRVIHHEKEVATLLAGDFFGEMALLHHEPRTATIICKTPCVIYELKSKTFREAIKDHPSIQNAVEKVDKERRAKLENL